MLGFPKIEKSISLLITKILSDKQTNLNAFYYRINLIQDEQTNQNNTKMKSPRENLPDFWNTDTQCIDSDKTSQR